MNGRAMTRGAFKACFFWKRGWLYTKGGADPTFASAKVKNAIGRIGIFVLQVYQNVVK